MGRDGAGSVAPKMLCLLTSANTGQHLLRRIPTLVKDLRTA